MNIELLNRFRLGGDLSHGPRSSHDNRAGGLTNALKVLEVDPQVVANIADLVKRDVQQSDLSIIRIGQKKYHVFDLYYDGYLPIGYEYVNESVGYRLLSPTEQIELWGRVIADDKLNSTDWSAWNRTHIAHGDLIGAGMVSITDQLTTLKAAATAIDIDIAIIIDSILESQLDKATATNRRFVHCSDEIGDKLPCRTVVARLGVHGDDYLNRIEMPTQLKDIVDRFDYRVGSTIHYDGFERTFSFWQARYHPLERQIDNSVDVYSPCGRKWKDILLEQNTGNN